MAVVTTKYPKGKREKEVKVLRSKLKNVKLAVKRLRSQYVKVSTTYVRHIYPCLRSVENMLEVISDEIRDEIRD